MNRQRLLASLVIAIALLATASAAIAQTARPAARAILPGEPDPNAQRPRMDTAPAQVNAAFSAWDRDHNGTLSPLEFRSGWQNVQRARIAEQRLRNQFRTVDRNHDGALDANEYAQLTLVRQAKPAAPALASFDRDRDGRLAFPEYLNFIRAMVARQASSKGR